MESASFLIMVGHSQDRMCDRMRFVFRISAAAATEGSQLLKQVQQHLLGMDIRLLVDAGDMRLRGAL